jgi:hypothetical protein
MVKSYSEVYEERLSTRIVENYDYIEKTLLRLGLYLLTRVKNRRSTEMARSSKSTPSVEVPDLRVMNWHRLDISSLLH